ncbi:MAG: hypothetical protein ACI97A_004280 [Planctomycetota bacterium]|jgi:hypothetical protein
MTREDLVTLLETTGAQIEAHAAVSDSFLDLRYGTGKWSIREVLAHLADVEMINAWRFLRAIAETGGAVEGFDESRWAENLNYASRPGSVSGALFSGSRGVVIYHFANLPEASLEGVSLHPEKGPMNGWQWAQLIHDHGAHHLSQLDAARDQVPWVRPEANADSWKFLGHNRQP